MRKLYSYRHNDSAVGFSDDGPRIPHAAVPEHESR
jgi:hypothetical protein